MAVPAGSPPPPRLFLVDGYALIYRAFYALISRPLTTSRGENTSAAWGIANFLQRLIATHRPEYIGWVHDSGLSFRHERYPAYKATRQKLSDDLQADFDRGMERICQLLEAYRIPILSLDGYEADDVIGTLAAQGVRQGVNVVIVSGDKDFQQLIRPGVWLLNPGRGGPAGVEEQWISVDNADERLGVPPRFVTDYLALVGDSSDNVPGVPGIGDKTARDLVTEFGSLEQILDNAPSLTKKRPREALLQHPDRARLSKELVTIRDDLPVQLDTGRLEVGPPDQDRLRDLLIELEFHNLAKAAAPEATVKSDTRATRYLTVDTTDAIIQLVAEARRAPFISVDTETIADPDSPQPGDPLRSKIVSIAIGIAPGRAYYLPLRHRLPRSAQVEMLIDAAGDRSPTDAPESRGIVRGGDMAGEGPLLAPGRKKARKVGSTEKLSLAAKMLANGSPAVRNLPWLDAPAMEALRALLEDPSVRKVVQNAKHDILALGQAGIRMQGVDFDTMLASYVLDPGRRSHGLDVLALEFLDHAMMSYEDCVERDDLRSRSMSVRWTRLGTIPARMRT